VSLVGVEGILRNVLSPHPDLVVAGTQVKLGKDDRTLKQIQQLIDDRDQILVFDSLLIKSPIINA
jgi:hypothetical protein